jgi:hypothetical protein
MALRAHARSLALAATLALGAFATGCSGEAPNASEEISLADEAVTDVNHSSVKRQSIGNCWLYAGLGWAESLNKSATGVEANFSESYLTFFHWYDRLVGGQVSGGEMQTGGSFGLATTLMSKYGLVAEGDFIAEEAKAEMSARQKSALTYINASIKSGKLSTAAARRNRATVKAELVAAWGLKADVVAKLDKLFGADFSKNLTQTSSGKPVVVTTGSIVKRPSEIAAQHTTGPGKAPTKTTLEAAIRSWKVAYYPTTTSSRRTFQARIQRALHDAQPVAITWTVDFNALDAKGAFRGIPATPGRQGGHVTILEDYEVTNVPGYGTLAAGTVVTDKAALGAALSSQANITFFRTKNSWGVSRSDRAFAAPGHNDLYMDYMNGPIQRCEEKADGSTDTTKCSPEVPFDSVVLPPGY